MASNSDYIVTMLPDNNSVMKVADPDAHAIPGTRAPLPWDTLGPAHAPVTPVLRRARRHLRHVQARHQLPRRQHDRTGPPRLASRQLAARTCPPTPARTAAPCQAIADTVADYLTLSDSLSKKGLAVPCGAPFTARLTARARPPHPDPLQISPSSRPRSLGASVAPRRAP